VSTAERTVNVYSNGIVHCSVCAPKDMEREEVERLTNLANLSGTTHGWRVSDDLTFASGEPNPHDAGDCGRHWLMVC
jgi:hypothetical protein